VSAITVRGCQFRNNSSSFSGGAAAVIGGQAVIEDCLFEDNTTGSTGGGLSFSDGASATVRRAVLRFNQAGGEGGAVTAGAGVTLGLESCLLHDNQAGSNTTGGGIWSGAGMLRVTNCTLVRNQAQAGGNLACAATGTATVENSLLRLGIGGELDPGGCTVIVRYSNVTGGAAGEGNIDAAVAFVDPTAGNFRLAPGAAGIDAADGDAAPLRDLDGHPRVDDPETADTGVGGPAFADMGAYEYQP
jgi:hypothetical protein